MKSLILTLIFNINSYDEDFLPIPNPFHTHYYPAVWKIKSNDIYLQSKPQGKIQFHRYIPIAEKILSYTTIALSKCQNRFFVNRLNFIWRHWFSRCKLGERSLEKYT